MVLDSRATCIILVVLCPVSALTDMTTEELKEMTPTTLLPWQYPWLQSLSVKNQMSPFATFLSGTGGLPRNRHGSHIVLTLPIRLLGVDDPWVR